MDDYAVAPYIVNYISKVDSGISKLLRQAAADAEAANATLRQPFHGFTNKFLNATIISAQQAAYLNLSMPLSKSSRKVLFINTEPKDSRVRMLKSTKELKSMDPAVKSIDNIKLE